MTRSQRGAEKEWVDNQRERIGPEREVEVDGGWIKGVWGVFLGSRSSCTLHTHLALLSPSLSTTSKHRQSHRRSHRQNLRYSRGHVSQTKKKKKQKETLSPASPVGLRVAAALLSNISHFYFSSNVKLSLLTSRIIMAAVCCCALSTVQYIS